MSKQDLGTRPLAFLDLETSGLDPSVHEILEIAICVVQPQWASWRGHNFRVLETFVLKVKPEHIDTASLKALEVNGYTEAEWAEATPLAEVMDNVVPLLEPCVIVGQNVKFDMGFIEAAMKKCGIEKRLGHHQVDTVTLAWAHLVPCGLKSLSLDNICRFLRIDIPGAHSAEGDVRRCMEVYDRLMRANVFHRLWWRFFHG